MAKKAETKKQDEVKTEETPPEVEQRIPVEQLTINDLMLIKTVFEVATQRGAFKAEELQNVGTVYNKLSTFLSAVMPKPAEGESAEEPKAEEETQGDS